MTTPDRHSLLIAAGWTAHGDMYLKPGADPQTAIRYNLDAAWYEHTRAAAPTEPKLSADPRRSKPI